MKNKTQIQNKYLMLFFSILFAYFSISEGLTYREYMHVKAKSEPITYSVVKHEHRSNRTGGSDVLIVSFNNKNYETYITSKILTNLRKGIKPTLYYSDISNKVFSLSEIRCSIRRSIVFGVFLLIVILIYFKIIPKIPSSWKKP